jgi:hypothetical protein
MTTVMDLSVVKELAMRNTSEDETVVLFWDETENVVYVSLFNHLLDSEDNFVVPNDKALDAYYHPHAYL